MALRSFDEISTGKQFPPRRELPRVQIQDKWAQRYAGKFDDNTRRLKSNMFRYLAHFWADNVISEVPILIYGAVEFVEGMPVIPDGREQEFLNLIQPALGREGYRCVVDLVKYGSAVLANERPFNPHNLDPRLYYRVIRPEQGVYDGAISCATFKVEELGNLPDRIIVTRHLPGSYQAERTIYKYQGLSIGEAVQSETVVTAHPQVLVMNDIQPLDDVLGISDYVDVDDYIVELHRRESAVSEALDRHVNPHLAVPEGVLRTDAAGNITLDAGGEAIPYPDGSSPPQYVTWEPDFTAHEHAMERALERIQRASGIAPVLAGTSDTINTPSGSALRRLAFVTVGRIRSFRRRLDGAFRRVCVDNGEVARLSGVDVPMLDPRQINVLWTPPLWTAGEGDEGEPLATFEYSQG